MSLRLFVCKIRLAHQYGMSRMCEWSQYCEIEKTNNLWNDFFEFFLFKFCFEIPDKCYLIYCLNDNSIESCQSIRPRSHSTLYSASHLNQPLTICSVARQVLAIWHVILSHYTVADVYTSQYSAHWDYVETHNFFFLGKQCQFPINFFNSWIFKSHHGIVEILWVFFIGYCECRYSISMGPRRFGHLWFSWRNQWKFLYRSRCSTGNWIFPLEWKMFPFFNWIFSLFACSCSY